jgi:hypothetical protein
MPNLIHNLGDSVKDLIVLTVNVDHEYATFYETYGELRPVFLDGKIINRQKFADIRQRALTS